MGFFGTIGDRFQDQMMKRKNGLRSTGMMPQPPQPMRQGGILKNPPQPIEGVKMPPMQYNPSGGGAVMGNIQTRMMQPDFINNLFKKRMMNNGVG